jgi:membrane protease YdiL (CAAX protease family)
MLFAVKNHLLPTLLILAVCVIAALSLRDLLGLSWQYDFQPILLRDLLLAGLAMASSDALLHGVCWWLLGNGYRERYRTLVEYFRPQHVPEIIAGGLLAGGEELLFRGVLLEGLRANAGLPPAAAILLTSLAFGLLHALPNRQLLPFTLWAIWEGAVLGTVYVVTGSLLVVAVLHILHDVGGFSLFAYQRRQSRKNIGGTRPQP